MLTPGNKIIIEPGKGALKGKTHVTLEVVHSELRGESVTLIVPNELMPLLGSMINQYNEGPKFLSTYVSDEKEIE